jgi:outer membrane protein TolC
MRNKLRLQTTILSLAWVGSITVSGAEAPKSTETAKARSSEKVASKQDQKKAASTPVAAEFEPKLKAPADALSPTFDTSPFDLNENALVDLADTAAPTVARIKAALYAAEAAKEEFDDKFATESYITGNYAETNEQALIAFAPIFSPVRGAGVGVRQNTPYGISVDTSVLTDQRTTDLGGGVRLNNGTTTTLSATFSLDLWQDLFGYSSRATRSALAAGQERARLESVINRKAFQVTLRKSFWNILANEESKQINEKLLKTAELQAKDANKRFKRSVADRGELARYRSQLSSRKASLTLLRFQGDVLQRQLRELVPEIAARKLNIQPFDLEAATVEVLACASVISSQDQPPLDWTYYDEVIQEIAKTRDANYRSTNRYSGVNVKLLSTLQARGVSAELNGTGTLGQSFEDIGSDNRLGYSVGLEVSIPIGSTRSRTRKARQLRDALQADADIRELQARILTTHQQLKNNIVYLVDVAAESTRASEQLKIRLEDIRRKYQQARVSVTELIADQDALLNADLAVISARLEVLNALFDYMSVFTELPCSFNQRGSTRQASR